MDKLTKYIIALAVTAAVLFIIWYFSSIVIYILISAVLSVMGRPLMTLLEKLSFKGKTMPTWAAASITLCAIVGLAVLLISLFLPLIIENRPHGRHQCIVTLFDCRNKPFGRIDLAFHELQSFPIGLLHLPLGIHHTPNHIDIAMVDLGFGNVV